MRNPLRVVIADDERPARALLASLLGAFDDVVVVGEARDGIEAVRLITRERPDLALLDLQMPEMDGLEVVRLLPRRARTLVAFVTAYDEYAVRAFELNAVDYLLKPVAAGRLRETVDRAVDRLVRQGAAERAARRIDAATTAYRAATAAPITSIPVVRRDEIVLVPVDTIASIVADGELLRLTTSSGGRHSINHRLKNLEARLDGEQFLRLSRGILVNVTMIEKVAKLPGGSYLVTLQNGHELRASRSCSAQLRDRLLRL